MVTPYLTARNRRSIFAAACILVALNGAGAVRADYVTQTYILDQSNVLADGVNYGNVKIEAYDGKGAGGGGLLGGQVRLSYTANVLASYGTIDSKKFGFERVGFNTDLGFISGSITAPKGWFSLPNASLTDFGTFSWIVGGVVPEESRVNPAVITISKLGDNATLDHFLFSSLKDGGGALAAVAYVGGFHTADGGEIDCVAGHYTGFTLAESPEPSSLILVLSGAVGIFGYTRKRLALAP